MGRRRKIALFLALALAGCAERPTELTSERAGSSASSVASGSPPLGPSAVPSSMPSEAPAPSAPPVDPDARVVTFHARDAAVGDVFHERLSVRSELDGSLVLKTLHMVSSDDTERDVQILALSGDVVTRVKITYTRVARVRTLDGAPRPSPGPVQGRSYFVERKGDRLVVEAADAKPLTGPEEDELRSNMVSLGKPDAIAKTLASKPRRVGERLDDVAIAMKDRFDADQQELAKPGDHVTLSEVVATLVRVDAEEGHDVGVLSLSSTMSGVRDGAESTLKTTGTMSFRLDTARVVRSTAEGRSSMKKGILSGTGKMTQETFVTLLGERPAGPAPTRP